MAVSLKCLAGLPPRSSHSPRWPPVVWAGWRNVRKAPVWRGVFQGSGGLWGKNFRGVLPEPIYALQGFHSLASRINGFGVNRRGLGAPGPLPGGNGVTRNKNGKC